MSWISVAGNLPRVLKECTKLVEPEVVNELDGIFHPPWMLL